MNISNVAKRAAARVFDYCLTIEREEVPGQREIASIIKSELTREAQASAECAGCKEKDADTRKLITYFENKLREAQGVRGGGACPCLHTEPCDRRCTCVNGHSSRGCAFCCSYGSSEQQRGRAEHLRKLILLGLKRETPPDLSWLGEIETRCNAASNPPWKVCSASKGRCPCGTVFGDGGEAYVCSMTTVEEADPAYVDEQRVKNAEFIAHARDDIPRLIRALREAHGGVSSSEPKGTKA